MNKRRLAGIDLGIASAHTVRVPGGEGAVVARRKAWPTVESLAAVEAAAVAGGSRARMSLFLRRSFAAMAAGFAGRQAAALGLRPARP